MGAHRRRSGVGHGRGRGSVVARRSTEGALAGRSAVSRAAPTVAACGGHGTTLVLGWGGWHGVRFADVSIGGCRADARGAASHAGGKLGIRGGQVIHQRSR